MAQLFGRPVEQARSYLGALEQVARVDSFVEADGPARGSRRLRMVNGGGLEIDVHPDRALDLGQVTVDGIPVAWMEARGVQGPADLDPNNGDWLRAWGGGMLTTCGLDAYGSPSRDDGRDFGQHGRVSGIPARLTVAKVGQGELVVEGVVRQTVLGGENLALHRRITTAIGSKELTLTDVVTNEGAHEAVHMMLYHANFGWPLVEDGVALALPSTVVEPRDEVAAAGLGSWADIEPPSPSNLPQVFLHEFPEGHEVVVRVDNRRRGLAMQLKFDRRQLPWLCHWKCFADRTYVLGLEPMNTRTVVSRAEARRQGALQFLQPGQSVTYQLSFGFEHG